MIESFLLSLHRPGWAAIGGVFSRVARAGYRILRFQLLGMAGVTSFLGGVAGHVLPCRADASGQPDHPPARADLADGAGRRGKRPGDEPADAHHAPRPPGGVLLHWAVRHAAALPGRSAHLARPAASAEYPGGGHVRGRHRALRQPKAGAGEGKRNPIWLPMALLTFFAIGLNQALTTVPSHWGLPSTTIHLRVRLPSPATS